MDRERWLRIAEIIDAFRVFPRLFITAYIIFFLYSGFWFMDLEFPNAEQAAFISVIVGAGAGWFGLYTRTGRKWGE